MKLGGFFESYLSLRWAGHVARIGEERGGV